MPFKCFKFKVMYQLFQCLQNKNQVSKGQKRISLMARWVKNPPAMQETQKTWV